MHAVTELNAAMRVHMAIRAGMPQLPLTYSLARREGMVNIQTDHILRMQGDGQIAGSAHVAATTVMTIGSLAARLYEH